MPCCFSTTAQPERVLQVFFACSDGSFFALCPVAPFHAAMSLSGVDQLVEISRCSADDTAHSTTQAWLDQVTQMQLQPFLPPPPLVYMNAHYCIYFVTETVLHDCMYEAQCSSYTLCAYR